MGKLSGDYCKNRKKYPCSLRDLSSMLQGHILQQSDRVIELGCGNSWDAAYMGRSGIDLRESKGDAVWGYSIHDPLEPLYFIVPF